MRLGRIGALASTLCLVTALPAMTPKVRRGPTAPRTVVSKPKPKTAQGIDSARATQIQTALIKAGYLSGTPSGAWDAQTQAAMEKLQADNGWQTRLVPDSRALIKLGLGPVSASSPAPGANPASTPAAAGQSLLTRPAQSSPTSPSTVAQR